MDEFPYEQIFPLWWYFQSRVRAIWKVSILVPGSNVKCLSGDRRWPRLVAGPNIIIQFRTRYQFHFGDQKTIWSNNCLQTAREANNNNPTCRPRRCCDPSPPWRSVWTAARWGASTSAARRAPGWSGPRPRTPHWRRPGQHQHVELRGVIKTRPDKSFQ